MTSTLARYRSMRDFSATPEPVGKLKRSESGRLFVVQKHDATRLHYDFRLELDGVLLSWAVTRGPSLNPGDKRLAVQTEDHPIEYGGFEGVIPSGYGAGTVMLWDRGEWLPQGDAHEGLKKGELKFVLHGERLQGGFVLVRLKPKPGEKKGRQNWLLIKERDQWADEESAAIETWTASVKTGRSLEAIGKSGEPYRRGKHYSTEDRDPPERKSSRRRRSRAKPCFVPPQLAQLADAPPEGAGWLHEIKFDGYRIIAVVRGGKARLFTRNEKDWTHKYRRIVDSVEHMGLTDAVLDGELVALNEEGEAAFSRMQAAAESESVTLRYYLFDLLHLDGEDLTALPLAQRKERLKALLVSPPDTIAYSDHIRTEGDQVLASACSMKLEGVVSKRADAPYASGRNGDWIKSKCVGNDEFVIGGFRKSDKRERPFASLLLGEFAGGRFLYRGRVGTGFDDETFASLKRKFRGRLRKTSPFHDEPPEARQGAVWLKPELVAQIAYMERTPDGYLRHPSFLGLREDKAAAEVEVTDAPDRDAIADDAPAGVRLTSPDKVLWPEAGVTKLDLASYYSRHADIMLPFLQDRPLSIVRCPEGADGECFFQKHHNVSTPEEIDTIDIREKDGGTSPYLAISTKKALASAAQIGALELHIWGSRADAIEKPERIVFDLDPDEGLDFAAVRAAALEVRDVLEALGLASFALLTGGKGVHVIAPIARRSSWDDVKTFSRNLASRLAHSAPDRYVASMSKKKRTGRIFIDYLRNERGSTAIAPFSPRRKPSATVATPVSWEELPGIGSAGAFTMGTLDARLARLKNDPWEGYDRAARQVLTAARLNAVSA